MIPLTKKSAYENSETVMSNVLIIMIGLLVYIDFRT